MDDIETKIMRMEDVEISALRMFGMRHLFIHIAILTLPMILCVLFTDAMWNNASGIFIGILLILPLNLLHEKYLLHSDPEKFRFYKTTQRERRRCVERYSQERYL